jgi:predicted CopG family antitoxin
MYYSYMPFTTVSIRLDVAKKLKAAKEPGESYSDTLERLLENQPAKSAKEWLESLAPLEGRGIFSEEERERLRSDQRSPRRSPRRRRATA